jgi:hypothetical protein
MGKTVVIGCKLPHGLSFMGQAGQRIVLNGMNTSAIAGGHGITHVDEDEAAIFFATHKDFGPVKNNAIFYHGTDKVEDVAAMAEELKDEKTGFEGLDPTKPAPGLEIGDGQKLEPLAKPNGAPVAAKGGKRGGK